MTTPVQGVAAPHHRTAEPARPLLRRVPVHVVVLGLTAVWLVPVAGLVVSSFRPPSAVPRSGWWESSALPGDYTLDNYRDVLGRDGMALSLANSLAVVVPATVLVVAVIAAAAYALVAQRVRRAPPRALRGRRGGRGEPQPGLPAHRAAGHPPGAGLARRLRVRVDLERPAHGADLPGRPPRGGP